jgi:putative transposase
MPRQARSAPGGLVYHVINRGNGRNRLFGKRADYVAFEKVMSEAMARTPTRLLGWCLMPNHWHLVLWPRENGELTAFVRWLTHTHTQRWHAHRHSAGEGHVYQGRFKSFPIQKDEHLLTVLRYVERNALRADLVERAEAWRWGSLWVRREGPAALRNLLSPWPLSIPDDWVERVNRAQTADELDALRRAVKRSSPYGSAAWVARTAKELDLQWTLRPRGRPRVRPIKDSRPL